MAHDTCRAYDAQRDQALRLVLTSRPGKQNPFDLTQEPDRTRDLYGREEWGQAFLVARRLVEAGVRMVQVNLRGWDTHQNAFRDLKSRLLPSIDHCLSGFLDDLEERGLLDETLVVMCGEMGRTPRISPIAVGGKNASGEIFTAGRHHWGDVFPCFFAGGGIEPGRAHRRWIGKEARPFPRRIRRRTWPLRSFSNWGLGLIESSTTPRAARIRSIAVDRLRPFYRRHPHHRARINEEVATRQPSRQTRPRKSTAAAVLPARNRPWCDNRQPVRPCETDAPPTHGTTSVHRGRSCCASASMRGFLPYLS